MREFELIERFIRRFDAREGRAWPNVLVGPGDDMALVRIDGAGARTLEVRAAIARRTFPANTGLRAFGRDAASALVGDLPDADGASKADGATVAGVLLPPDLPLESALELEEGVREVVEARGLPIVGGDVAAGGAGCDALVALTRVHARTGVAGIAGISGIAVDPRTMPDLELLVACDGALAGRHAPREAGPRVLARKALLRNLSDVAAMGNARPIGFAASLALPARDAAALEREIRDEFARCGAAYGAALLDCAAIPLPDGAPIWISVAILAAKVEAGRGVALRSHARPGDAVYVTGSIGGAWDAATGFGRHLDFTPRLDAAHALVAALGDRLGALIDVSDGLGRDLGHVADASDVDVDLDLARVPVAPGLEPIAAIGQGEDYELAFTARGEVPATLAGVPATRIGSVRARAGARPAVVARAEGRSLDVRGLGYEHGA